MLVVADATPLISLMKIGRLNLLERLFGQIVIPEAVYSELTTNVAFAAEVCQIEECSFINRVSVSDNRSVDMLRRVAGLDLGESEAIVYADVNGANILLIDESKGRRIAQTMGLKIMGTLGMFLEAFYKGILTSDEIEADMVRLRKSNRHIGDDLIQYVREKISKA
jgi:hypothetical protein